MAKVVLHIGTHKTATTLIQDAFAHNRKLLAQHDIIYPTVGTFNGHHMLVSEWVTMAEQYQPVNGADKIWEHLEKTSANNNKTIVLSSEEFSRAGPTRVDMKQLRERLSFADSVEVICFLRDQKSFLQSVYLEIAKKRQPKAPTHMHKEALETHFADGLFLNYNKLYDHLLTGFSKDEITFVPFNPAREHDGGVLGFFLKFLGFKPHYKTLSLKQTSSNISADPLTAWVAGSISAPQPPTQKLLETVQTALEAEYGSPLKTSLFAPAEIQQLKTLYDALNQTLSERISDKQPHFNFPPLSIDKTIPHRGSIGGNFWLKLLRQAYRKEQG
jgi:hypothetical protein